MKKICCSIFIIISLFNIIYFWNMLFLNYKEIQREIIEDKINSLHKDMLYTVSWWDCYPKKQCWYEKIINYNNLLWVSWDDYCEQKIDDEKLSNLYKKLLEINDINNIKNKSSCKTCIDWADQTLSINYEYKDVKINKTFDLDWWFEWNSEENTKKINDFITELKNILNQCKL